MLEFEVEKLHVLASGSDFWANQPIWVQVLYGRRILSMFLSAGSAHYCLAAILKSETGGSCLRGLHEINMNYHLFICFISSSGCKMVADLGLQQSAPLFPVFYWQPSHIQHPCQNLHRFIFQQSHTVELLSGFSFLVGFSSSESGGGGCLQPVKAIKTFQLSFCLSCSVSHCIILYLLLTVMKYSLRVYITDH